MAYVLYASNFRLQVDEPRICASFLNRKYKSINEQRFYRPKLEKV